MVAAKATEVKEDKHYPPKCTVCDNEIYTFTESNDTCVIEALHECRKVQDVDQTIVEDVPTSSGSNTSIEREKTQDEAGGAVTNNSGKGEISPAGANSGQSVSPGDAGKKEGIQVSGSDTTLSSLQDDLSSEGAMSPDQGGILDDPGLVNISACETSILVITDVNPLVTEGGGEGEVIGKEEGTVTGENIAKSTQNLHRNSDSDRDGSPEKDKIATTDSGQDVANSSATQLGEKAMSKDTADLEHQGKDEDIDYGEQLYLFFSTLLCSAM